jgi:Dynamin family
VSTLSSSVLGDALEELRVRLRSARLSLEVAGLDGARLARAELIDQIEDYVLPRVRQLEAPILAVVGGSTGAGKSTLVNSIVGSEVSASGVLRPTTRVPVLICNPADMSWFEDDRILPKLTRTTGRISGEGESLQLISNAEIPPSLALLDAPDIDSVVKENAELASKLLAAADLWLFVTTAARYADAVPWSFLRAAEARSTAMAIVLNRVPREAADEVPGHLAAMLKERGLGKAPIFSISETALEGGLLPETEVAPIRRWLVELARDAGARTGIVRTTLEGALDSLTDRVETVASEIDLEVAAAVDLLEDVIRAYGVARSEMEDAISGGSLLRGEVLARWQEVVGTGELMRTLEARIGHLRDQVVRAFSGRPPPEVEVREALGNNLVTVILATSDRAAERVAASWQARVAGKRLVASDPKGLSRSTSHLPQEAEHEVRAWQAEVLELVRAEGADKRAIGRAVSLGVNAVGAALMVAVFAHTGGLTGGEIAIAGGTATLSQKLLEALFGDQAVRSLSARARSDLLARIDGLLDEEKSRYQELVASSAPRRDAALGLRAAAQRVQEARVV